jgi:3-deoxy-D-manno-octulosonic-acid transferase
MISGDTRFDRVIETALNHKPIPAIAIFCKDHSVLVAGSTWENDETLIDEWLKTCIAEKEPSWKLILVPHEVHPEHLKKLHDRFPDALRYSQLEGNETSLIQSNVLIIDRIGILSNIYYYATACYIGGGFNKSGHHNILEAAVYGKPTITAPNYEKFRESVELKKEGGSFTIRDSRELYNILKNTDFSKAKNIAETYVHRQKGATELIVQWVMKNVF